MGGQTVHRSRGIWALVRRQHGVISREQLLQAGLTRHAIDHRLATGRLHAVWRGVFAVGRPQLTREGLFMAAVLACGEGAVLSHESAAELWGIRRPRGGAVEVSVPHNRNPRRHGIKTHRRTSMKTTRHKAIPITSAVQTLIDLSPRLNGTQLERAVN